MVIQEGKTVGEATIRQSRKLNWCDITVCEVSENQMTDYKKGKKKRYKNSETWSYFKEFHYVWRIKIKYEM